MQNRFIALAGTLRSILEQGLHLSPAVVRFIDATLDNPDAPALAAVLAEPETGEAETLLELIFYPDAAFQEKIEDLLEPSVFPKTDRDGIVYRLCHPPLSVPLVFPDARGTIFLTPPDTALERMVGRLNIHRSLSPPLDAACSRLGKERGPRARVMIRNAANPPDPNEAAFLCAFLDHCNTDPERTLDCLALALKLFGELPSDNIQQGLVRKKNALLRTLERGDRMERAATGQNMETRMMRGMVTPHIDRAKTKREIDLIDTLCRAAFGRAGFFSSPANSDLGTVASGRDMADLIRKLS